MFFFLFRYMIFIIEIVSIVSMQIQIIRITLKKHTTNFVVCICLQSDNQFFISTGYSNYSKYISYNSFFFLKTFNIE